MAVAWDPMTIASQLMACVCAELEAPRGEETTPGWEGTCCVRPGGDVPWDSCCEGGGQAWVVLKSGYPTTNFPVGDTTGSTVCGNLTSIAAVFEVGVLRCVCFDLCDCDTSEDNAAKVFGDMTAVLRGINCCLADTTDDDCGDIGWRMNGFEMLGPKGGCGGSKFDVVVNMNYPCCPAEV